MVSPARGLPAVREAQSKTGARQFVRPKGKRAPYFPTLTAKGQRTLPHRALPRDGVSGLGGALPGVQRPGARVPGERA